MPGRVNAQVVLRSSKGTSILDADEEITAENIAYYQLSEAEIAQARQRLEAAGFDVVQEGPVSFSIEGPQDLFERVFKTTLETAGKQLEGGAGRSIATSTFRATRPFQIPDDLADVVADVTLPTPPDFFP